MPTDNELILPVREILSQIQPGHVADTIDIASAFVANLESLSMAARRTT